MAVVHAAPVESAVRVAQGAMNGTATDGVRAYLGIPYAAPPVGDLRWRAPAPAPAWKGVREATAFGASCMQGINPAGFGPWTHEYVVAQGPVSEDCLFLNVWTPAAAKATAASGLPVMLWIHGGGFSAGSGSVPVYDGAALAKRGILVVSINYRLGALGYLAHPELSKEAGGTSGNYAVQDMIAALRWVQKNIGAFGGDPAQVTIAGQSAGSASVHALIAAPQAKGLFVRAIAQSGSGMGLPMQTLADAERGGAEFAKQAGAATLQDLRAISAEDLLKVGAGNPMAGLRFSQIVDGKVLPRALDALQAGDYADTPVLTGLTADEGSALSFNYGKATPAEFSQRLNALFPGHAEDAGKLYPHADAEQAGRSVKDLTRERGVAAAMHWAADRRANGGKQPIYLYLFAHVEPSLDDGKFGAFHSAELPYVFQMLGKSPERPFTRVDHALSEAMAGYWVNFVRSGDPNGADLPRWPAYVTPALELMRFDASSEVQPALPANKRAFFEAFSRSGGKLGLF